MEEQRAHRPGNGETGDRRKCPPPGAWLPPAHRCAARLLWVAVLAVDACCGLHVPRAVGEGGLSVRGPGGPRWGGSVRLRGGTGDRAATPAPPAAAGEGGQAGPKLEWLRLPSFRKAKKKQKSFPVRQRLWSSFTDVFTALAALEQAPGALMKSKVERDALFLRQVWNGFLPVLAYASTSIYMVISQAYVLRNKNVKKGINYSTLLLFYQNICGIMIYFPTKMLGYTTFEFFSWHSAGLMLPNSALFAIMVYSSAQTIRKLQVPMISVLKNAAPITITLVEWLIMKGPAPSAMVLMSMGLLVVGAIVAAMNDLSFTVDGYLWMLANIASNVSHLIVLRKLKLNKDLSNTQILHYSALWSLVWLIPVGLFEGMIEACADLVHQSLQFKLVVFSTGINSILMFLATIWCLERTSGSTYSMVGALNKIPIAIMGYLWFNSPSTKYSILGITIGLLGGIVFTMAKLKEMKDGLQRHRRAQGAPCLVKTPPPPQHKERRALS